MHTNHKECFIHDPMYDPTQTAQSDVGCTSRLGFSARMRWATCPVSVTLSAGQPDRPSAYASEGNAAHAVAAFYVRQAFSLAGAKPGDAPLQEMPIGSRPDNADELVVAARVWNDQLQKYALDFVHFLQQLIRQYGVDINTAHVEVERAVCARSVSPRLAGTLDVGIWLPTVKRLLVVDYKFGYQLVDIGTAELPNMQLSGYAAAALDGFADELAGVTIAVYSPRCPQSKFAYLELPPEWLGRERERLQQQVAAVEAPGAPVPGPHCSHCPAVTCCPVVHQVGLQAGLVQTGLRDLRSMSDDEVIALWASRQAFEHFFEEIDERIQQLARAGHKSLTIQERRGRQVWVDAADVTYTLLACGLVDCLQPRAISDVLPKLPPELRDKLVTRGRPARSIRVVSETQPAPIAEVFAKYVAPR